MNRIFAIGETVLDMIFRGGVPCKATPGGSMLNASVSLGRLGADIHFIGEYGTDRIGRQIDAFLRDNGVATDCVYRYSDVNSSLALAFLDENGNAEYQFYKPKPAVRLDVRLPEAGRGDMILFGSFFSLEAALHAFCFPWLEASRAQGALLLYDPNFRKAHLSQLEAVRPLLRQNLAVADIVRASDEDCALIFGSDDPAHIYRQNLKEDQVFICTSGSRCITRCTGSHTLRYTPPAVQEIVSTVGAGDTFNAGLAYGLTSRHVTRQELTALTDAVWEEIIMQSARFSASVCQSDENYIKR
ncbi:MAG: carbohydrate kinase [Bacteroidales bacterium]|nr:carbohydrate kinase [Bacteroidales bacterium]